MSDSTSSSSKPDSTKENKNAKPGETAVSSIEKWRKEIESYGAGLFSTYDSAKKTYENVSKEISPTKIDKDIMQISEKINKDYSYTSMLLRTHGAAIKVSSVIIPGYLGSFLGRRMFMFGATTGLIMSSTAIYLAEYKWINQK